MPSNTQISKPAGHLQDLPPTTLFNRKWAVPILICLISADSMGFNELKSSLNGVSNRVLSATLQALQENPKLVNRDIVQDNPLRVQYSLTERGQELEPVIREIVRWSNQYDTTVNQEWGDCESGIAGLDSRRES